MTRHNYEFKLTIGTERLIKFYDDGTFYFRE